MRAMPAMSVKRRPLAGPAAAAAAGCACGLSAPCLAPWFLVGAAASAAFGFAVGRRRPALRVAATLAAAFLLAAAHAARCAGREAARTARLDAIRHSRTVATIAGTIVTEPTGFALPQGGGRLSFRMRVRSISLDGEVSEASPLAQPGLPVPPAPPVPFDLDVDFYGPVSLLGAAPSRPTPQAGEGWSFAGRIQSREVTYRRAPLLSLHASIRDEHRRAPDVEAPAWRQALWALRRETARRLTLGLGAHPEAAAVLRALLLGYRAEIPTEVRDFFANSGTVHLFAISGLHIMLVAGTLRGLLRRIGASSFAAGLVLIPTIIAYTELTGGRPSAQRACLMAVLYYGAPIFRRKSDALNAVAVAAIALLAANPLQVADLGFAFSFTSVLGILLLARPLERALWRIVRGLRGLRNGGFGGEVEKEADELEARMIRAQRSFEEVGWWRRQWWNVCDWCHSRGRKFISALAVSIAAWAVAEPITASVFGQMVPISVVSNVLVIFLGSKTVKCAAAGLVLGVFFPWLGVLINRVAAYLVEAMIYVTSLFARVPGGNFHVEPWSPALVAAWYVALCAAALAVARRNRTSA